MREFIDKINLSETSLTPRELAKHQGKYLEILIQLISTGMPVQVDPARRSDLGDYVQISKDMLPALEKAIADPESIQQALPRKVKLADGTEVAWNAIFKSAEFTARSGRKDYNTGHLAELFLGFAISTRFANAGNEITESDVMEFINKTNWTVVGKNYRFEQTDSITYPEPAAKNDNISFVAIMPGTSAEAFLKQVEQQQFARDLSAILNSAIKYANDAETVADACERVRLDKETNKIEVISDGSSDASGTKADIVLKLDGEKINLLSLKTYSTGQIGQLSGIGIENLQKWFMINFDIDISPYQALLDDTLSAEDRYRNLLEVIYDEVVYPKVESMFNDQSPATEAAIVKNLVDAANFYARGQALEDVEIIKLDDKIKTGNFKVLKFSDDLVEAMQQLDLETRYLKSENSRTIQIWVKPEPDTDLPKGANKLCQFRTFKSSGYPRNIFEIGSFLELLTAAKQKEPTAATRPLAIRPPGAQTAAKQPTMVPRAKR